MGKGSRLSGPKPSTLPGADTALREVQHISMLAVGAALPLPLQGRLSRNSHELDSGLLTSVSGEKGVKARLLDYSIKTFQQLLLFVAVYGSVHGQITQPEPWYARASSAWVRWGILEGWSPPCSTNTKQWPTVSWSTPDLVLCERKHPARSVYRVRPKRKVRSWPRVLLCLNHPGKQLFSA